MEAREETARDNRAPAEPWRTIALAVVTRRRPAELARLLASLSALEIPSGVEASLVVVENDAPHARALPPCTLPATHLFEPRQGIPVARNRALAECAARFDAMLFLDDDETVEPSLLARLVEARRAAGTQIVTGPALPRFEPGAPAWAARSGAYEPVRHPHLARVAYAFTNNVIFDASIVRGEGAPRFDESMLYTGGSDREFFARLAKAGHAIAWADDAIAYEWYPPARASFGWLFRRSFRLGTVAPETEALRAHGAHGRLPLRARATLLWRAARFLARGCLRAARRAADPGSAVALGSWDFGRTAGLVAAVCGRRSEEYRSR